MLRLGHVCALRASKRYIFGGMSSRMFTLSLTPHENASCEGKSKPTIGIRFRVFPDILSFPLLFGKQSLNGPRSMVTRMPEILIQIRPWIVWDMVLRTLCRIHLSNCCEYTIDSILNIACFDGRATNERPRAYPVCWFDLSRCLYNEMMHTDYLRMPPLTSTQPLPRPPPHKRQSELGLKWILS